jgi:hypothetical protein
MLLHHTAARPRLPSCRSLARLLVQNGFFVLEILVQLVNSMGFAQHTGRCCTASSAVLKFLLHATLSKSMERSSMYLPVDDGYTWLRAYLVCLQACCSKLYVLQRGCGAVAGSNSYNTM